MENRILIHAPHGRDAQVIEGVLAARQLATCVCRGATELLEALEQESAATIVTEEALVEGLHSAIGAYLARQPPWSDYPFVVLATRQDARRSQRALATLRELGNLVLVERPVHAETLASAAQSALRARKRQYAGRRQLQELAAAKQRGEQLNGELESRIQARTHDLASANNRLMREIAERERAQSNVVQGQKMEAVGQLTGGLAHDFNNLLQVVNINLELIDRLVEDARVRGFAAKARDAVAKGSRLTGQLLSFARSQSLVPKLLDVNTLIGNMSELIGVSLGSRIRLVLELEARPAFVVLDAAQLEMALLNLAVNSRDAMPKGGQLSIRTEVVAPGANGAAAPPAGAGALPARQLQVSVRDSGVGIPPSLLAKVFDPFFTTKPLGAGTGLGLSQVYGFARQSGGTAELSSTVGEGTTVRLRFPLADAAEQAQAAPFLAHAAPHDGPAREVLVVEDDAGVRESIVEGLHLLGYVAHEAADGLQGLHALEKARPDLLLVDFLMPGMNGAELIVQARRLHPGLPILMATGFADMAQAEKVIHGQAVLVKPFDVDTLGKAVAAVLPR